MTRKFDLSQLPHSPDLSFELPLWAAGAGLIAGIDEAGRGALAGPVSAAAVILPSDPGMIEHLSGVRDSKQMTPAERASCAVRIRREALACCVGFASNEEIDSLGILPATRLAVRRAIEGLPICPQHLLVDYLLLPEISLPQTPLVKGDARSLSIASASVLAKTARDELICKLDTEYPGYGFARHKGYGTAAHREAIERLGPCPIHRITFAPVKRFSRKAL